MYAFILRITFKEETSDEINKSIKLKFKFNQLNICNSNFEDSFFKIRIDENVLKI